MTLTRPLLAAFAAAALAALAPLAGCGSSSGGGASSCSPGSTHACDCSSGALGSATCDSTGTYGACECGGGDASTDTSAGNDTGTTADSGTGDGDMCNGCGDGGGLGDAMRLDAAPGTFGSTCNVNTDCNSMDCSQFPAKGGGFCTQPCTTPADCPPQALGCNGMGQCKVP